MSIEVRNLTKIYGVQRAVDDLNFTAMRGEITGFLGPNGAGKSTTMKIATGYLEATEGDVLIDEVSVSANPLEVKKITGYLPEHNPLYHDMYVKEFLNFVGKAFKIPRKQRNERIHDIIARCGLQEESHKHIRQLSKGYRQRVGLAKALLPDPSVLILDEPTTGLDPNQILEIRNLIRDISKEKTVILSTHIMQEVEAICDKVIIINKGKLMMDSPVKELKNNKQNETVTFEISFDSKVESDSFGQIPGVLSSESISDEIIRIECKSVDVRKEILNLVSREDYPLVSINQFSDSLENIFKELTTETQSEKV